MSGSGNSLPRTRRAPRATTIDFNGAGSSLGEVSTDPYSGCRNLPPLTSGLRMAASGYPVGPGTNFSIEYIRALDQRGPEIVAALRRLARLHQVRADGVRNPSSGPGMAQFDSWGLP